MEADGITDKELLKRLGALYPENFVQGVAEELVAARAEGGFDDGNPLRVKKVHDRFTYRMHNLSRYMQGLLIRFTAGLTGSTIGRGRYGRSDSRV